MKPDMYHTLIRPLLFRLDPENAHNLALRIGAAAAWRPVQAALRALWTVSDERLAVTAFGLRFPNPLGLAAGMDKRGAALYCFDAMGFGAIELGTVTAQPQPGNPRPRIFRLRADGALINRMGFPSDGACAVHAALSRLARGRVRAVLGVNIGKTKVTALDAALEDYLFSFKTLYAHADYFVINVSSPNTPDLRKLQDRSRLQELVRGLRAHNPVHKPVLVKVAPDLSPAQLDEVVGLALDEKLSGIIAVNTTVSRDGLSRPVNESGGLSGPPLHQKARSFVRHIAQRSEGRLAIIGVGGVSSAAEVLGMLQDGAALVQLYTALVYRGPGLVKQILGDLLKFMEKEGIKHISEVRRR